MRFLRPDFPLWCALLLGLCAGSAHAAISVGSSSNCSTLGPGQTCTLTALVTPAAGVTWNFSPTVPGATPGPDLPHQNGLTTKTYAAPSSITQRTVVVATATAASDGATSSVQIILTPGTVTVSVSPATVSLTNGQTQQFTATLQNAANTAVTWSISPDVGSITANGIYIAPVLIGSSQRITVTATSVADPTRTGTATVTISPVIEIGGGAPTGALQYAFLQAYQREGFAALVSLPPVARVRAFGSGGYVQEFSDAAGGTSKYALVTASLTLGSVAGLATSVMQFPPALYTYYNSVGANTAGYPLQDGQTCPRFDGNSCTFGVFDKGYALFAYGEPLSTGQNFTVNGAYYTEWAALNGIQGLGRATSGQTAITAAVVAPATTGTTATVQSFANGEIYTITSGVNRNKTFGVPQPIYDLYASQSGPYGTLGLPTSALIQVSAGVYRQTFEGGALQYTGSGGPILQYPVASVRVTGAGTGTTTLNVGQTLTLSATPIDTTGNAASDRPVSWSTSNSKVATIQPNGATAVVTAVGAGVASVTASSQGVTSPKVSLLVISPCCQIGDGAPAGVQQAFQEALARNRITAQVPASSPAQRAGGGYVQLVQSADGATYLLAYSGLVGSAYVVSGAILTRYQALGGAGGELGYPAGDASVGGTQFFVNGQTLAGNPVRVVSGAVLAKWNALGRETGAAGPPVADAAPFATFGANSGASQGFARGVIYGASAGPRAGQGYFVSGPILARYNALGGAGGDFGMPASDEFTNGNLRQQNFEGGNITYPPGGSEATEHAAAKVPGVVAAPSTIVAGGRARLAVTGFPSNSTIRVSVAGQPDFQVTAGNGAYAWDIAIPLAAKSGAVAIHAVDTRGGASADGVLTVRGFNDNRIPITKLLGDNQTGLPGALLPQPLRVALLDSSANPIVGAQVVFQASGGQLSANSAVTDANGRAEVYLRLPDSEGVKAVTADAPSIAQSPVTFFVRAAAGSLVNFPKLLQAGDTPLGNAAATIAQKGALLTATAAILRYHQNRGELAAPNGPADPAALNQYLRSYCTVDLKGSQVCDGFLAAPANGEQIVNLWRAADFTGGVDVTVASPTAAAAADLVAEGSPALLSLELTRNGAPAGGHFVVAIGVAADGSVVIHDSNPLLVRTSLKDYLAGFNAGNAVWKATIRGVVRFALRSPGATRFLVGAVSQPAALMQNLAMSVQSAAGACGQPFDAVDAVDAAGNPSAGLVTRLLACDGSQSAYQLQVGATQPFRAFVQDLASAGSLVDVSGSAPASYKATRPQLNLLLAPQDVSIAPGGVVNAASFTGAIAPGGIVAIFGSGLAGPGAATTVDFDGVEAVVLSASGFQVNAQAPPSIAPGAHVLRIRSVYGLAEQPVAVSPVAPAIFVVGNPPVGAVVNQNGSWNGPSNPAPRGQYLTIYGTGFGEVVHQGAYSVTRAPVTAWIGGQEVQVAFAGLTPGFTGLYQINLLVPAATPPGLGVSLTLRQAGALSNTVEISLQ